MEDLETRNSLPVHVDRLDFSSPLLEKRSNQHAIMILTKFKIKKYISERITCTIIKDFHIGLHNYHEKL